jgi:hypothetical protein
MRGRHCNRRSHCNGGPIAMNPSGAPLQWEGAWIHARLVLPSTVVSPDQAKVVSSPSHPCGACPSNVAECHILTRACGHACFVRMDLLGEWGSWGPQVEREAGLDMACCRDGHVRRAQINEAMSRESSATVSSQKCTHVHLKEERQDQRARTVDYEQTANVRLAVHTSITSATGTGNPSDMRGH